jgi:hypothetical protein
LATSERETFRETSGEEDVGVSFVPSVRAETDEFPISPTTRMGSWALWVDRRLAIALAERRRWNALAAVVSSFNAGVTAATAREGFRMADAAEEEAVCSDVCAVEPGRA